LYAGIIGKTAARRGILELSMRTLLVILAILLIVLLQGYLLPPYTAAPALPASLVGEPEWIGHAEQIALLRIPLYVVDMLLPPWLLWSFVRRGAAARLQRRLRERGLRNQWLLVGGYALIIWLGLALLRMPFQYAAYAIRQAYGLSAEPWQAWIGRTALAAAVEIGPSVLVVEGLYWLLRTFPRIWWLPATIGSTLISVFVVYVAPIVITPLFFTQRPLADDALRTRIVAMAAREGVEVNDVFVIDASKQGTEANAYLTGIGDTTRIVLYDTLLGDYPEDELIAILAHELGHWRLYHIWQGLILSSIAALFGFIAAHLIMRRVLPRWGIRRPSDIASLPFLVMLLHIAMITTLPLQNWQSRRWEAEADRVALAATNDSPALARTFVRLARQNLSDPTPPRLIESLFATHPAIGRRVAAVGGPNP
jgi:STE24 endopeptidase